MSLLRSPGSFPETRWSLILRAQTTLDAEGAARALNELCTAYWQPLYVFLRRTGHGPDEAQDVVQGFLGHVLASHGLNRAQAPKGRFRSYLLTSLRNYLISEHRRTAARKRAGSAEHFSLDAEEAENVFRSLLAEAPTPEAAYDRQWAQTVWTRALQQLRTEYAARGREHIFQTLVPYLTDPEADSHQDLADRLGISTQSVATTLFRMRRRLRELVIEALEETVGPGGDLEAELTHFLSVWSQ